MDCTYFHEIFPGTSNRRICLEHDLKVPIDNSPFSHTDHAAFHGQKVMSMFNGWTQEEIKDHLCREIGVDYELTRIAVSKYIVRDDRLDGLTGEEFLTKGLHKV